MMLVDDYIETCPQIALPRSFPTVLSVSALTFIASLRWRGLSQRANNGPLEALWRRALTALRRPTNA